MGFDASDPLNTPRGLHREAGKEMVEAARRAVDDLRHIGIEVPLAQVQYAQKGEARYPINGGPHETGQYNVLRPAHEWDPERGYGEIRYGTSYQLWVEFTQDGPTARSILSYSQSDNPASPFYEDQTLLAAEQQTKSVRFHEPDIVAHCEREVILELD